MTRVVPFSFLVLTSTAAAIGQGNWEKMRSIAESQHEILMLLIKNQQYGRVLAESKKVFSMSFPAKHQHLLVQEAKEISHALLHQKQHQLAHEVLNQGLESVTEPDLQAELYKEKAYLFKKMGEDDHAMSCFKKSVELEQKKRATQTSKP
ncbi:MAG: hypothetical protein ACE5JX_08015 [Acidobacteriota bacterium]